MTNPATLTRRIFKRLNAAGELLPSVPLERLVRSYLGDFQELRDHGLKWGPIARGLTAWRSDKDQPVTPDHLRAAYSRASKTTLVTRPSRRSGPDAAFVAGNPALPGNAVRSGERDNKGSKKAFPKNKSLVEQLRATTRMRPEAED